MFATKASSAIVAVSDLARARGFYADTLDLAVTLYTDEVLSFQTGATTLVVYRSDEAGSNRANAIVWDVGADFDAVADELRGRGVTFEEYPDLGMAITGGVHSTGDFKAIWFKDPDGNILHVNSG